MELKFKNIKVYFIVVIKIYCRSNSDGTLQFTLSHHNFLLYIAMQWYITNYYGSMKLILLEVICHVHITVNTVYTIFLFIY